MRKLTLIDTHCDTAFELFRKGEDLDKNTCHISLDRIKNYKNYTQFFAVWANKRRTDDEAFEDFLKISDNLKNEIEKNCDRIILVNSFCEMTSAWEDNKAAAFLAVEDARILGNKIERIEELSKRGVKYLTLLWGGNTCIGSSHDSEGGLTAFGKEVVKRCFEVGIVPDISHANEQSTDEVIEIAYDYKKPFIATHSNCFSLFPHTRNLRERHLKALIKLGGIVGLNLCPYHIKDMRESNCTVDDAAAHIEKYLELGAENNLGMGCDLDGAPLPEKLTGVDDLYMIADRLAQLNYSEELIDKIFYRNFYKFIENNF